MRAIAFVDVEIRSQRAMSVATRPQHSLLANVAQSAADERHGAQRKPVVREARQTGLHPELTRQRGQIEGLRVAAAHVEPPHMGRRLYADPGDIAGPAPTRAPAA